MHPDLYLRIYHQQEQELEQRLMHRLAERERARTGPKKSGRGLSVLHVRPHRKGAASL